MVHFLQYFIVVTVQLVGGGPYSGNVIVNGRLVCDEEWDLADAWVVCGMLFKDGIALEATKNSRFGYEAIKKSRFGYVEEDFSMTKVHCQGNETSLLQCGHVTEIIYCWGAAGVVCRGNTGL